MKITGLETISLYLPMAELPCEAVGGESSSHHMLIRVHTDEGLVGIGETFRFAPAAMSALIETEFAPLLLGQDPLRIRALWDKLYSVTFRYARAGLTLHAISGVEIALWDIMGKFYNMPVYRMLGGACRDRVRAYASMHRYATPADVAFMAERHAREGYTAIKLHQHDVASVRAARERLGMEVPMMLDASGAWTPIEARRILQELGEYRLGWVEEPLKRMDDYATLAELHAAAPMPLAAGENEYTSAGFLQMLKHRALDVVQPDVIKAGGLLQCMETVGLARAFNVQLSPHSFYYGPGLAATLHFAFANPLSDLIEVNPCPLAAPFMTPMICPENGFFTPPDRPGLGIELNEDVIREYRRKA